MALRLKTNQNTFMYKQPKTHFHAQVPESQGNDHRARISRRHSILPASSCCDALIPRSFIVKMSDVLHFTAVSKFPHPTFPTSACVNMTVFCYHDFFFYHGETVNKEVVTINTIEGTFIQYIPGLHREYYVQYITHYSSYIEKKA